MAISFDGLELQFSIDDVTPENLMYSFELTNEPKFLFQCTSNLVVPSRKWLSNLKPGCSYYIKNSSSSEHLQRLKDDIFGELILHSLIASTAVYHINHLEGSDECKNYLQEQLENHNFEYVTQSRYGENTYILAKEMYKNRIYVAFSGTKELSDWKYNVQVLNLLLFVCCIS